MQYIKLSNNRRCCTACLRKNPTQLGDLSVTLARTNTFQCYDLVMERDINVAMRKGFFQQVGFTTCMARVYIGLVTVIPSFSDMYNVT